VEGPLADVEIEYRLWWTSKRIKHPRRNNLNSCPFGTAVSNEFVAEIEKTRVPNRHLRVAKIWIRGIVALDRAYTVVFSEWTPIRDNHRCKKMLIELSRSSCEKKVSGVNAVFHIGYRADQPNQLLTQFDSWRHFLGTLNRLIAADQKEVCYMSYELEWRWARLVGGVGRDSLWF
jgi:hypothetical protein